MKIALFNPDLALSNNGLCHPADDGLDYIHPPLGLLSIATSCFNNGFEVFVFDLNLSNFPKETFKKVVAEYQPDIAGFSVLTSAEAKVMEYAKYCKNVGLKVILGGHAVSSDIQRGNQFKPVADAIIIGEGEYPLVQLLKAWKKQSRCEGIPGVILGGADTFIPPLRVKNLDKISVYNFDLIDMEPYVKKNALGMVTSRGCCFNCHFCSCQKMWKRKITKRSLQNIFNEIDYVIERYQYHEKMFTFFDETFTFDRRRILEFCRILKHKPYRMQWKAMTRVDKVDLELLTQMADVGCKHVVFGIEGVSDRDLKLLNKGYTEETARKAIWCANQAGLISEGYFMMGFPWQSKKELFQTIDKIRTYDTTITRLSCLTPLPGTFFADNAAKLGMHIPIKDTSRYNFLLPIIETENFGLKEQAEAMLAFIEEFELKRLQGHGSQHHYAAEDNDIRPHNAEPIVLDQYKLSPYLITLKRDDEYLIFEYKNGSLAIINQTSFDIMNQLKDCNNLGQMRYEKKNEWMTFEQQNVYQMIKSFLELGFLVEAG